ncbi:hypothetical protein quinque_004810 [Culex quinquefasciatus]
MFDHMLVTQPIPGVTPEVFYRAANIYLQKPHVVNRKLFGASTLATFRVRQGDPVDVDELVDRLRERLSAGGENDGIEKGVREVCDDLRLDVELLPEGVDLNGFEGGYLVLKRLLPRNLNVFKPLEVLAIVDPELKRITFRCLQDEENNLTPKFSFAVQLVEETLSIICKSTPTPDEKSSIWLKEVLFRRLLKWIDNLIQKTDQKGEQISLGLINDLEEYNRLYGELKTKYGTEMVRIWPESTDPRKFVYEDVAIATYLLLLWKQEREESGSDALQSFVDLGCGNGLLVYILASEGHPGVGIDLRKRKIWDCFPGNVTLRVESIDPSGNALFPDTDWIIGNHSDELSPWIPVLAARSAFRCRYFLLPCCAFEFDGTKFQRQNSSVSQYGDFLRYAKQISAVCGFETATDRLKIPSTKRTCLIGSERTYREDQFEENLAKIQTFIDSRTPDTTFKARPAEERVRNCTKISRSVVDEIVRIVFEALIAKRHLAEEHFPGKGWNAGGTLAIGELVRLIPADRLAALKSECGGLQTLLRNNHQIFAVLNGTVQLRLPTRRGIGSKTEEELKRKAKKQNRGNRMVDLKERPCWFFGNHPDGCPFEEEDCKFKH